MKPSLKKQATFLFVVLSLLLNQMFTATPAYAAVAPTLLSPAHNLMTTVNNYAPLGIPEFKWSAVSGTINYRIQVSSDIAFTTKVVDVVTPNLGYTPINSVLFTDGDWYWHVRVESPVASLYSPTRKFVKKWAIPANLPVLVSPANGETVDFYDNPTFSWNHVKGAARYRLQIYASPGGWSNLLYAATSLAPSHQPIRKLANGTSYYWRVIPMDVGNHDGTPSQERSFNASYSPTLTLLAPAHLSTPTFTPSFSWTAVRGAEYYLLQYTTNTDGNFNSNFTQIRTSNTSYTPIVTIPNDIDYFWRVRAHSGYSVSDWTPTRKFKKMWYIKPQLLTPVNNYQHQRLPLFSWTPVPGASYYKFELSLDSGFSNPIFDTFLLSNTFYSPHKYIGSSSPMEYFWRVTPYDADNKSGVTSISSSYFSYSSSIVPHQVYPLYYYTPDFYGPEFSTVTTNPHEDRTVALPIFIWHRVLKPISDPNAGDVYADGYRVQVSQDLFFGPGSVEWEIDTENTVAAPTVSNPFNPLTNTTYYWRVCTLVATVCDEVNGWSQTWAARFDPSKKLAATSGAAPTLLRPTDGYEYGESTPLLEWFPFSGAASYDVQISSDQGFSNIVDSGTVAVPAYAPLQSLAQRSLGDVDFGIYYWRVRQSPSGTWSATKRFQIAAQSQWKLSRTLGNVANQLQIGSDPSADVSADYDLTDLQAAQDVNSWYFGFHVPSAPTQDIAYGLYLDLDHKIGSGGTTDPRGYTVTTPSGYRPEYAIYVFQDSGVFASNRVYLYAWSNNSWVPKGTFQGIGGTISYVNNYVELKIAATSIISTDVNGGSYALSLFSLPSNSPGSPQDSVPSDPNVPGSGAISRFSSVTERMNILAPPHSVVGLDPSSNPSVLPFFWDAPILAPWTGTIMKAYLDDSYSNEKASATLTFVAPFYERLTYSWGYDLIGDNTYYWRIRPQYRVGVSTPIYLGAWSQGWTFARKGFMPKNLKTSVTFATPVFSWDMVEGAKSYDLEIDDDQQFGSPIRVTTMLNFYTSQITLPKAIYYWRVKAKRYANGNPEVANDWAHGPTFTLTLPKPINLTPANTTVNRAPTLCWSPVVQSFAGTAVMAAWKYRVQVSKDATFSNTIDVVDTEQSCWTPSKGYEEGKYYWRVAIIDGDNKLGDYTAYQVFTKQYPKTTLVSPTNGGSINGTPRFSWTPVNGAASYKLEVAQNNTFSPMIDSIITDNTSYTPTKKYIPGSTYYWRVSIIDKDGRIGPANNATIILTLSTVVSVSAATQDGWILESTETSEKGGTMNATTAMLQLGDNTLKKQYRSILSFNTGAGLPDNAVITRVTLKIKKTAASPNPVAVLQGFMVDIKNGFFGTVPALQVNDFEAGANQSIGPFVTAVVNNVYTIDLTSAKGNINRLATGNALTQIRLRFKLDDNNNALNNILSLYSGNTTVVSDRPQLVIQYYIP